MVCRYFVEELESPGTKLRTRSLSVFAQHERPNIGLVDYWSFTLVQKTENIIRVALY